MDVLARLSSVPRKIRIEKVRRVSDLPANGQRKFPELRFGRQGQLGEESVGLFDNATMADERRKLEHADRYERLNRECCIELETSCFLNGDFG